uniref:zinc finger CCHC domain-containing protein 7 n=1 Tax=Gasterosteus aculeatus aculeatus TaxID=481459 RepID=UPI001A99138C|nr:zinc finger CCHC domain-containing protein 7 [Gasterosteus aculeatus aculeatus]XP_040043228.1 zinc finger CCHC domain-containing protein 7 [Gasterosteus aculeatus aculeatus]
MYGPYQYRRALEDELYRDAGWDESGESDGSEANSELEFHLYSQLHYSSNAGALEEQGEDRVETEGPDSQQHEAPQETVELDCRPPSPDLNNLLECLRKKKKKQDKLRRQKTGNANGPKSFSSFIEEVIVIDSGPDVISISENDNNADDDEGVCALKGRSLRRLQTSTPAQQGRQKRSLSLPVTVDSSTSASSSDSSQSDSSYSSDSDDLENWMILGRGRQDGDQSISLNLEGGSDGTQDAEGNESDWLVSAKDQEAQIYNKGGRVTTLRVAKRYYTDKNVQCRNCSKNGHLSTNCPEPKKLAPCFLCGNPGHGSNGCPNKHCNNCGLPGHLYNSCSERAHWHKRCERCGMKGHLFDACPEIWRQYHITTKAGTPTSLRHDQAGGTRPAYCYNCSMRGHFGHACGSQKMYNWTYHCSTFINYYDTKRDIKRREQSVSAKAKELKKNGFFTNSVQTHLAAGPPIKKRKFDHYNHHPHPLARPPHQTPSGHKPNHIFFKGGDVFTPPKTKKNHKNRESNAKPWKPKRPVPAAKAPVATAKVIVDEAKDFPRGGGKGGDVKAKKKKKMMGRSKQQAHIEGDPDRLGWTVAGEMQGAGSKPQKKKKKKNQKQKKTPRKAAAEEMYPTDENLFLIKQRKRRK